MDFNRKIKYYDENTLILVTSNGLLRLLRTPFQVRCILPTYNLRLNMVVYVEAVAEGKEDKILYRILGEWVSYKSFSLIIK